MGLNLINRQALERNRARATANILQQVARDEVHDRLEMVNRTFMESSGVAAFPKLWHEDFAQARVVEDTDTLDLDPQSSDFVFHAMALHWANDPVGQLIQCRRALKPDGLFLGIFLGGQTLKELRACLGQAESEINGGLSPRILPMVDVRDAGGLLQRAGFALPVADVVPLKISYHDSYALMHDLRAMGENNAMSDRRKTATSKAVFERASHLYTEHFTEGDRIVATFEFIVLTGWAPDSSQPQPLRRGSATTRLSDALGVAETPLDN